MTKYLLDTQVLIWWFESSKNLPGDIEELIKSEVPKVVSVVSFWEMIIKIKTGKLRLGKSITYILKNLDFEILNVNLSHVLRVQELPDIHKDPFDRILIAQSKIEGLELLTSDKTVRKYFK